MTSAARQPGARLGSAPRAALVAFVLICQAAAWVHAAATPHVTCLEHGESVHLAGAAPDARDTGATGLDATPGEVTAHAHEHCNLQGHRTTSAPAPAPVATPTAIAVALAPAPSRAPAVAAVLRFAPKTSPPRTPAV